MSPSPRPTRLLPLTLALVALVLRLLLPLLHYPGAQAAIADRDGGTASGCACIATSAAMPWWQEDGNATGDGDERERGGDQITAAPATGHCLACAEAHLPPAPPPPPFDEPHLVCAPTPTTAAPRAPPLAAAERSQHHSRAPPHPLV